MSDPPTVPCPTPEGIGAKIGRTSSPRSRPRQGAQRPKASARRSADPLSRRPPRPRGAQRPKASARRSGDGLPELVQASFVPNARRHRREDRPMVQAILAGRKTCPTPEGIGAKIGRECHDIVRVPFVPNARRHRREDRSPRPPGSGKTSLCPTPEGIGAKIGRSDRHGSDGRDSWVPNARRHRREDRSTTWTGRRLVWSSAQRPKASARRSEAYRGKDNFGNCLCPTPEGIGAKIGLRMAPISRRSPCAQRPKASARRSVVAPRRHTSPTRCAQRPKASARRSASRTEAPECDSLVPNARRHRREDRANPQVKFHGLARVPNARRHRREDRPRAAASAIST